jgi:hypothetical protein
LGVCGEHSPVEIAAPAEQGTPRYWKLGRSTPVCELNMAFKIPHVYDYIAKICRTQVEVILNHVNLNMCGIG